MFLLTRTPDDSFIYGDLTLHVDMSFNNVLLVFELFEDNSFSNYDKAMITLEMLVYEYEDILENLSFEKKLEVFGYVLKEFLGIDINEGSQSNQGSSKKTTDWSKDAGLIYASFMSEYKIDLFAEHDRMHWDVFTVLLSNLNEKTPFKQVVNYRTMEIPSTKKVSEEYRKHVIEMKEKYSLEDIQNKTESLENKLDSVASTFGGGGGR